MQNIFNKKNSLNLRGQLIDLSTPKVMGILNITPDSFYDGGKYSDKASIKAHLQQMETDGVDIIDVGAYSSRPGANDVSSAEELKRLNTTLEIIREHNASIPISVDTFRSEVADAVLRDFKVEIINDISGGSLDNDMYDAVAKHKAAYILMHMRGTPQTMSSMTDYKNMVAEILYYFSEKIATLKSKGIMDVVIDPGFGFAKDLDQNYTLLSQMHLFDALEAPILAGISRKSMIYKLLDISPQESLNGTTAVNMLALTKGANILRVHDVKEAKECISIYNKMLKS